MFRRDYKVGIFQQEKIASFCGGKNTSHLLRYQTLSFFLLYSLFFFSFCYHTWMTRTTYICFISLSLLQHHSSQSDPNFSLHLPLQPFCVYWILKRFTTDSWNSICDSSWLQPVGYLSRPDWEIFVDWTELSERADRSFYGRFVFAQRGRWLGYPACYRPGQPLPRLDSRWQGCIFENWFAGEYSHCPRPSKWKKGFHSGARIHVWPREQSN